MVCAELLDWLTAHYTTQRKATPQFRAHLWPIREIFGERKVVDISDRDILDFIGLRREGKPPRPRRNGALDERPKKDATINRELQLLGQALRYGARRYGLPTPDIRRLDESGNVRRDFFERAQLEKVVTALPEDLRDFTRFAYCSAWRKGEIAALRWEQVDWSGMEITLRAEQAKNRQARSIPIEGQLVDILRRRREARSFKQADGTVGLSEWVFHRGGERVADFRKAWRSATKAAGCPGHLFHGLRRSGVRNMIRAGVPQSVAQEISGHRSPAVFKRYDIVSAEDKRRALQRRSEYESTLPAESKVVALPATEGKR